MSWPVRCPGCRSLSPAFKTGATGNVRKYRCGGCEAEYLATIRGLRSGSAMSEPKNLDSKDMKWTRIRSGA